MLIREIRAADVRVLDALLRAAYGQPSSYVARLEAQLAQRDLRSFVAVVDGRPAGMVLCNDYGRTGYVALMGVDPAMQRRGIAAALMRALVAWCDERNFEDVQLDATSSGAPLYERFGFADAGETVVVTGRGITSDVSLVRRATRSDRDALVQLDHDAFGADRAAMLNVLFDDTTNTVLVHGEPIDGYAVVHGETIGPWIARDEIAARALLAAGRVLRGDASVRLCLATAAPLSRALTKAAGFATQRGLRHMVRGRARPHSPWLLGRANLGQG